LNAAVLKIVSRLPRDRGSPSGDSCWRNPSLSAKSKQISSAFLKEVIERLNAAVLKIVSRLPRDRGSPSGDSCWRNPSLSAKSKQISSAFLKEVIERLNAAVLKIVSRLPRNGGSPSGSPRTPFYGGLLSHLRLLMELEESLPLR